MQLYRLSVAAYATTLTGEGAALRGGRWNSPGVKMLYTSDSPALSMAEARVHLTRDIIPPDYVLVSLHVPDIMKIQEVDVTLLDKVQKQSGDVKHTQKIGDAFIAAGSACILKVPSAVVKGWNFLINPAHPDFANIRIASIEPFVFDERMFQ